MRKIVTLLLIITFMTGCVSNTEKKENSGSAGKTENVSAISTVELVPVWSTDSILLTPESAIFDADREIIYVSNINQNPWEMDGNGFISKVNLDGEVTELNWVSGLNAPKGMGLIGSSLYVTDNDAVVEINVLTGEILSRIASPDEDAKLNDITTGADGSIYISGSESSKVYTLKDGSLTVFAAGDYERPNGLLVEDDRLLILSFNGAALSQIDLDTKAITRLADGIGKADGIIKLPDNGGYITSSWSGQVFHISEEYSVLKLLDTEADAIGAADIEYIADKNLLLVPTFYDNRLMAYRVEVK